jgi:hypothetical protein
MEFGLVFLTLDIVCIYICAYRRFQRSAEVFVLISSFSRIIPQPVVSFSQKLSIILLSVAATTTIYGFSAKVRWPPQSSINTFRKLVMYQILPRRDEGRRLPVEGGLKEVLDEDDPRRPERPIVEYGMYVLPLKGQKISLKADF